MSCWTPLPGRASGLAWVAGIVLSTAALGQEAESPRRSVYDRRGSSDAPPVADQPAPRSQTTSGRRKGYLDRAKQPAAPQPGVAPSRMRAKPGGLAAPAGRRRAGAKASADQGVVPAFFPAPAAATTETTPAPETPVGPPPELLSGAKGEHPLLPAVRWAKTCMERINKIEDYSATLVKRERIDGELGDYEYLFVKVRHEPFSIYIYFLGPPKVKGQEAIFVAGKNNGKLAAHPNGLRHKIVGTLYLDPTSNLAMSGNRYPITELGLRRLTERLLEVGAHDVKFGECEVKVKPGVKVDKRECTLIEVEHPVPREEFLFNRARIYVDSVYDVPVRYEAYEWPSAPGGKPVLTEEYTYVNLKFNNGFTDKDFDVENPEYGFKK
jgi:hypothetical protein